MTYGEDIVKEEVNTVELLKPKEDNNQEQLPPRQIQEVLNDVTVEDWDDRS